MVLKCKYAWSHLDFLQGEYAPCYRFKIKRQPIASLSDSLPSSVINKPAMLAVRDSLQRNSFPPGCSDCEYKESHGLMSYRHKSLADKNWDDNNRIDYTTTTIPHILDLELKFSRTCNFLCRHCMSDSNSQFEIVGRNNPDIDRQLQELDFDHLGIGDSPITTISPEIVEDLIKNVIPTVERITFSGGEPLYHLDHYRFLERLISDKKIDTKKIILSYNTNLSLIRFKSYELSELWKHFKSIHITVSMDGTGKLFNYFRERGDYDTVISNLYSLLDSCDNIGSIYLVCTCTSYHAFYADRIFGDLTKIVYNIKHVYGIDAHTGPTFVHYPDGLDMANLPQYVKDGLIIKLNHSLILKSDPLYHAALIEVINHLKNPSYSDTSKFAKIVALQDQLHNKNCKQFLPELAAFVYNE